MRISDWSSDVCSSDLLASRRRSPARHFHRYGPVITGACGQDADNGIWGEQADAPGMGQISFTANLHRHLPCPSTRAEGSTVREVLVGEFVANHRLRAYLLDDQGRLRRNVNIFVTDI